MTADGNDLDLLDQLIAKAKAAGADAADALFERSVSLAYAQRLGTLERLEREENSELGLRVLIGRRQAVVSSNDTSAQAPGRLGRAGAGDGPSGAGGSILRSGRPRSARPGAAGARDLRRS